MEPVASNGSGGGGMARSWPVCEGCGRGDNLAVLASETGSGLRFGVLGPLEVWLDGVPVRLGGGRQRALLGMLLVRANELVRVEELVEQLFDEPQADRAVHALRVAVSRLRAVLESAGGRSVLVTRTGGYVLVVEPGQLDSAEFERALSDGRGRLAAGDAIGARDPLRQALGLWRGSPLADLAGVEPFQVGDPAARRASTARGDGTNRRRPGLGRRG